MITFDFKQFYQLVSSTNDELEKVKIEASYFRYYDSLSKKEQQTFKKLDKETRLAEADRIETELKAMRI